MSSRLVMKRRNETRSRGRLVATSAACGLLVASTLAAQPSQPVGPNQFGGRTRALIVVEGGGSGSQTLLAGSVGGGLWRSTNSGINWEPVSDFDHHTVTSLVADPQKPQTIYAGTGEIDQNLRGGGIFRSPDGGENWTKVRGTDVPELSFIRRLAVSADGTEILAATSEGLYHSATSSFSFSCALPMNGGCAEAMSEAVFDPKDADKAIAASAVTGAVFYRDRNPQTGRLEWHPSEAEAKPDPRDVTWRVWSGDVSLAYAKKDSRFVYAFVNGASETRPIWRSDDGGKLFEPRDGVLAPCVTHLKPSVSQGIWANLVWAGHPADENFLIVGRVDLWRSTDGGTSLTSLSDFDKHPHSAHADHHVLATGSSFGRTGGSTEAWVGTDGGVFYTSDLTRAGRPCEPVAWEERNCGFSAAEFYSGVALANGTLLAGTQDLGLLRSQPGCNARDTCCKAFPECKAAGTCWTAGQIDKDPKTPIRDDVLVVLAHPTNPVVAFALGNSFDVLRTQDSGESWKYISDNRWNGTSWIRKPGDHWQVESFGPDVNAPALAIDAHQPPHLYLGGSCLYRGSDLLAPLTARSGPTWSEVQAPLRKRFCEASPYIVAIATTPTEPEDLWICYDDGRVFRTTDALNADEPSWHRVRLSHESRLSRPCQSIQVTRRGETLITYGERDRPTVYRVSETGPAGTATYSLQAFELPAGAYPHRATAHPDNEKRIFVATDIGVFERLSSGTWQSLADIPSRRTEALFWHGKDLYVGTYGAGMYLLRAP